MEANEAREASDQCAKALRDYISDNRIGETGSTASTPYPPLPISSRSEDQKGLSKWSFKLWNGTGSSNPGLQSAISPASNRPTLAESSSPQLTSPILSKKIGSFFGSRGGSISSISSTPSPQPSLPQMPSMYRGSSDASSTEEEEPMSPALESSTHVMVRDDSGSSMLTDLSGVLIGHGKEKDRQDEEVLRPLTPTATSGVSPAL